MSERGPGYIDYEVTYPLGFTVSVPEGASEAYIIQAYTDMVADWVQDGNMPAEEFVEIVPQPSNEQEKREALEKITEDDANQPTLLDQFRIEVCEPLASDSYLEEQDWSALSVGFFLARGASVDEAEILAAEARYTHQYWLTS